MMNVLFVTQAASVVLVRARPKLYKIVSSQRSYLFSNDVGGGKGGREGELQTNIPLYRIKDRKPAKPPSTADKRGKYLFTVSREETFPAIQNKSRFKFCPSVRKSPRWIDVYTCTSTKKTKNV